MKTEVQVEIMTSNQFGPNFCDEACEHFVLYVKFPAQAICKICGILGEPDSLNRFSRSEACKYLCGGDVPERFWSPLREQ